MSRSGVEQLADFVGGCSYDDLPPAVLAKAREIAQHSWGVQLAASALPWSKAVARAIGSEAGAPQSTVVMASAKASSASAAFVNGSYAHAFEFDDNHAGSGVKVGCVSVPAALAVGERLHSSGRAFLLAVALGAESMVRIGLAIREGRFRRGGHATGTTGAIGAALIAGKLAGHGPAQLAQVIACASVNVVGSTEAPATGRGHLKRTFGGAAAASGIRAASMAEAGITGPLTMLDPGSGLFRAFDVSPESAAEMTGELGSRWHVLDVHYKVYAQDGYIQPMTEALEHIRSQHTFDVSEVAEVVVGTNSHAYGDIVGNLRDPHDLTDAQFSANFSVALYLLTGNADFDAYTEENLADPAVRGLSSRVRLVLDDEVEEEFQRSRPRGARVTVHLRDGRRIEHYVQNLRSLSQHELDDKFRRLASRVMSPERVEGLLAGVKSLSGVPDISVIAAALRPETDGANGTHEA